MSGHYFKFDARAWREAAGFSDDSFQYSNPWSTYENTKIAQKSKIHIAPNRPINTSLFEEAIVLEVNGVPTAEGLKERLNDDSIFCKRRRNETNH